MANTLVCSTIRLRSPEYTTVRQTADVVGFDPLESKHLPKRHFQGTRTGVIWQRCRGVRSAPAFPSELTTYVHGSYKRHPSGIAPNL